MVVESAPPSTNHLSVATIPSATLTAPDSPSNDSNCCVASVGGSSSGATGGEDNLLGTPDSPFSSASSTSTLDMDSKAAAAGTTGPSGGGPSQVLPRFVVFAGLA